MSCEKHKSRLLDFALGAEEADVRTHLDACPSCRVQLAAQRALLEKIDRGVASMVSAEPSGDFSAHVRRRIANNSHAPRSWFVGWIPVTAAALALVVLVGVLIIGRPPRPPQLAHQAPPAPFVGPREIAPPDTTRATSVPSVTIGPRLPRPPQSAANREPEVLVPRGEMVAVMRLFNSNWNGKADGATLMAAAVPTAELLKPLTTLELNISPLQIEQLGEEGKSKGSSENR